MTDEELQRHVIILKRLFWLGLAGIAVFCAIGGFSSTASGGQVTMTLTGWRLVVAPFSIIAIVPIVIWAVLLSIWHWKSRYRGSHSKLWGAILVIETSGLLKIVYILRHVLPDSRSSGRYAKSIPDRAA